MDRAQGAVVLMSKRSVGDWLMIGFMVLLMCSVLASMIGHIYLTIWGQ